MDSAPTDRPAPRFTGYAVAAVCSCRHPEKRSASCQRFDDVTSGAAVHLRSTHRRTGIGIGTREVQQTTQTLLNWLIRRGRLEFTLYILYIYNYSFPLGSH